MKNFFFTIFTPVYNGESYIHRAFESIHNSEYRNFEWIIINDGSLDKSDDVIKTLIRDSEVDVIYINWNTNRGKHIAWNYAAKIAKGDIFIVLDCDDGFCPMALSFLNEKWSEHYNDRDVYGIDTLCINPETKELYGTKYPHDGIKATFEEMFCKYNVKGEKWNSFRTEYMKEISFPELKAPYYTENYMLNSLSLKYKVIGYNTVLREYYYVPTSLVNKSSVKLDIVKMNIHYNAWFLKIYGWNVLRMNPKVFFETVFRQFRRICIRMVMEFLGIQEIIRKK